MIARMWRGLARSEKLAEYVETVEAYFFTV
jgi:hypothetical protein